MNNDCKCRREEYGGPFFIDFKLLILFPYGLCTFIFMATKPELVIYIAVVS
jgi:hypothetical protein